MSRIDKMSLKEIVDKGVLEINERDMYIVLGRNVEIFNQWRVILKSKIRQKAESEQRMSNLSIENLEIGSGDFGKTLMAGNKSNSVRFTLEDIEPFESYIDKKVLVLLSLYNLQRSLEKSIEQGRKIDNKTKKSIGKAIKMIGNEDFDVTDPVFEDGYIKSVRVINSQELISIIRKAKKLEELEKAETKKQKRVLSVEHNIGLDNVVLMLTEREFSEGLTRNEIIGGAIASQISYNGIKRYQEAHPEIDVYKELEEEEREYEASEANMDEDKSLERKIFESREYKQSIKEAIIGNYRYIDIDMMLLIVAFKYLEMIDCGYENQITMVDPEEDNLDINQADKISAVEKILIGIVAEIEGNPEFGVRLEDGTIVDYSKAELKKDLRRFNKSRYIKRAETKSAKDSLLSNDKTFPEIEESILRTMDITDEEFEVLIRNSEANVIYLINQNVIGEEEIMQVIYARETCSETLFITAYQKGLLDYEKIIKLFDDKKIDGATISKIEDEELIQRINDYARESLRESYLKISNEEDAKPEDLERFVRCVVLYKKISVEGRTEDEIANNSFKLISSFEDNISDKVLQELYQFGIISLEAAADWGADLTEMLASDSIKPVDLRRLYTKKIISKDEIKNVLTNGNLTYEEKLDLIYSTFDGESEEEIAAREELTGVLEIGMGDSYKSDEKRTERTRGMGTGVKGKEFITEPHTRWKLISLLDKDYSRKCLPEGKEVIDGHRVFLLPNHNKVVIERMHEKRNGKRISAYGSATYVMSTEEFFKNIDSIIIDGAINRTYLREAQEKEQATKIIHSKHWGDAIKRQFGVESENSKYTKEEIDEINKAIANVENSRKERVE